MLQTFIKSKLNQKLTCGLILFSTLAATQVHAYQDESPKVDKSESDKAQKSPKPEPLSLSASKELLQDAIQPYIPGKERARFLRAAGVDTELSLEEAKANLKTKDAFIRVYDTEKNLTTFDRDKNKQLNWFEADAYRRSLRAAVIGQFDKDENRQLNGPELIAAATQLNAGQVPNLKDTGDREERVAPAPGRGDDREMSREDRRNQWRERRALMLEKYDANGNGRIDGDERHQIGEDERLEGRNRLVEAYDKNGDGILSDAEREQGFNETRGPEKWFLKVDQLGMTHFDTNNDGILSEEENKAITEFGRKIEAMGKKMELDILDLNGDGEISQDERQKMQQRGQMAAMILLPKAMKWGDANGDGDFDREEREIVIKRVTDAAQVRIKEWTNRFDANQDGRLDVGERDQLLTGIRKDFLDRMQRHNADGGDLSSFEMANMLEELAGEWGVKPAENQ